VSDVHIHTGGPKVWGFQVRAKWQRKCEYFPAEDRETARLRLFATLGDRPDLVEGAVLFSQEWYDPQAVVRVKVSR